MSTQADQQDPQGDPPRRGKLGELGAAIKAIPGRIRAKPLQTGLLLLATVVAVVVLPIGVAMLTGEEEEPVEKLTLETALENLDEDQHVLAREQAVQLRSDPELRFEEQGGPVFILGAVMSRDAGQQLNPAEQKKLFLIAARYLEEARDRGFPPGREAQGLHLLGRALYQSGRYAAALGPLQTAAKSGGKEVAPSLYLLAEAYLREANPQLQLAADTNAKYRAIADLPAEDQHAGHLQQARIQLAMGDIAAARKAVETIPDSAAVAADAMVTRARVLLAEGDALLDASEVQPTAAAVAAATNRFNEAIQVLRLVPTKDEAGRRVGPKAQYLLGVCYRKTGDYRAAETQFSRTRRLNFNLPEGIAAGLEEAELQQLQGKTPEAVASFQRLLKDAGPSESYSNPWFPLDSFRDRIVAAHHEFVAQNQFAEAIELTQAMPPLFPPARALEMGTLAQRRWAEFLLEQAAHSKRDDAKTNRQAAWQHYDEAGRMFERLARLRIATRHYTDDLWNSADSFLNGRRYRQAIRMLHRYLEHENRLGRPRALVSLGKAYLAANQIDRGLVYLNECLEFYPKHPDSYQARLVAARAHLDKGELAPARQLLTENLENENLTPDSLDWRNSLITLGRLSHRQGMELETRSRSAGIDSDAPEERKEGLKFLKQAQVAFRDAIDKLGQAVERYPQDPAAPLARYLIAESHRHAAKLPRKRLPTVTIVTIRNGLEGDIQADLQEAERLYGKLILDLLARHDDDQLSDVEEAILRNCYFARGDCLYDLRRWQEAIQAYSTATNRFQNEPAALEAFVQIANCYRRLKRPLDARGALERAKVVLNKLQVSDAEFERATRYDRTGWQQLLQWMANL